MGVLFFFFKQKTAYEMRIGDWSSDVCSSDLGGVLAAVEDDVLDVLAQLGVELVVDRHRAGVDDSHVHAGLDGVVQEHRVDRLAHDLVAAERERDVGDAAGDVAVGQGPADDLRRLDEDRKSTRLNSSNYCAPRMQSFA